MHFEVAVSYLLTYNSHICYVACVGVDRCGEAVAVVRSGPKEVVA